MKELHVDNQTIIIDDCLNYLQTMASRSVDAVITSPPYNIGVEYRSYNDKKPRDAYIMWMKDVGTEIARVLKADGAYFLNMGSTNVDPWIQTDVAMSLRDTFVLQNHIIWAKSISVRDDTFGHFKPINSRRFLNHTHESIYHFTLDGHATIDRLAIGVPFQDKTNILRRGHAQDRRCGGNIWYLPYETVMSKAQKYNHPACVDTETECLTLRGWKKYDEVVPDDFVAQYDLENDRLVWDVIKDIHIHEVTDCPMIHFKNKHIDMVLTENHRVIGYNRQHKLRIREASCVRPDSMKFPVSALWKENLLKPVNEPLSRDWSELLGWYIAEGYDTKWDWVVEIYQSVTANHENVIRIRELLRRVGADYTEATSHRLWKERPAISVAFQIRGFAATYLRQLAPNKKLESNCLTWSKSKKWALLRGLVLGDGHIRLDTRKASFCQKDEDCIGLVQALAFTIGISSILSIRHPGRSTFQLYFSQRRLAGLKRKDGSDSSMLKIIYSGTVWCLETPATSWVARRNGRIFVTGNSFPVALPERCIKLHGKSDGLVLDPFLGTGATLLAAARLGWRGIGIEIDQQYALIAEQRLQSAM